MLEAMMEFCSISSLVERCCVQVKNLLIPLDEDDYSLILCYWHEVVEQRKSTRTMTYSAIYHLGLLFGYLACFSLGYVTFAPSIASKSSSLTRLMQLEAHARTKSKGKGRRPGRDFGSENTVRYIHKGEVERDHPLTLLEYVVNAFPGVKRTQAKQWLSFGALTINDEMAKRHDHKLELGDTVMVRSGHIRQQRVGIGRRGLPSGVKVLYEDEDLLALSKPAGMLAVSRKGGSLGDNKNHATSKSLLQHANTYLIRKAERQKKKGVDDAPGSASLANYVDAEVSGVVLFAKSPKIRSYLQSQWGTFGQTCVGVVEGRLSPSQGGITSKMVENDDTGQMYIEEGGEGEGEREKEGEGERAIKKRGRIAKSVYRTLHTEVTGSHSLQTSLGLRMSHFHHSIAEVSTQTHLRDQVRCQLAWKGTPVVGDTIYGSGSGSSTSVGGGGTYDRLYLHVAEMRIARPHGGGDLTIISDVPPEFEKLLSVLKKRSEASGMNHTTNNPGWDVSGDKKEEWATVVGATSGYREGPSAGQVPRVVTLEAFLGPNAAPVSSTGRQGEGRRKGRGRQTMEPPPHGKGGGERAR